MGCGGSKVNHLPLVVRCRERKDFLKAAADHRYALAAAHLEYFVYLKDVGEALRKFVDEELVYTTSSSSTTSSPVVTFHTIDEDDDDDGEDENKKKKALDSESKSEAKSLDLTSEDSDDDGGGSHLHLSDDEESESTQNPTGYGYGYGHYPGGYPAPYGYQAPPYWGPQFPDYQAWGQPPPFDSFRNVYYMKRAAPAMRTVIHEASNQYSYEGFYSGPPKAAADPPPPPSPRGGSAWDFFDPFQDLNDYGFHPQGGYGGPSNGFGSGVSSSPDSVEVRRREGIPDLEDETEAEAYRELNKGNKSRRGHVSGEGGSGAVPPLHKSSASSKSISEPSSEHHFRRTSSDEHIFHKPDHEADEHHSRTSSFKRHHEGLSDHNFHGRGSQGDSLSQHFDEDTGSIHLSEDLSSSPDTLLSTNSPEDVSKREKEVSFAGVDETPKHDVSDNKTELSTGGTRDLREVVAEIRDEFATASGYGIEVASILEVGKLPYQQSLFQEILSRLMFLRSPSLSPSYKPSASSAKLAAKTSKLAKSYFGDLWKDGDGEPNLSSTLETLYMWEKKLYKEVKAEEKLRLAYEKQCKHLQRLDENGAESTKIDALRASIRNLNTKLKVFMKTIDAISTRIHKLRDEVLQPQLANLIHGLIAMWKSMLGCHQKQFQAIMDSKMRSLKANTGFQRESSLRATRELEMELRAWSARFNDWINTQKSYVLSLNGWLMRCVEYEPEETPDGPVPYSPGRLEAPPIFLICNDWLQAMESVSNIRVANAMHTFASSLHELWEKQDEEQRQRAKAQDLIPNEVKNRLRKLLLERGRTERELDSMSDKTLLSLVLSENGIPAFNDLKVDLDLVRKKLVEERAKHKDAVKIVHDAASSSVQGGLVPIFKALESFSSEALKVHEQVRLKPTSDQP